MVDRFLAEVRSLHDMRATIRGLSADERVALARYLNDVEAVDGEVSEWIYEARDAQLPPCDLDWCWLFSWWPRHRQVARHELRRTRQIGAANIATALR
jgi:hypothetical protein